MIIGGPASCLGGGIDALGGGAVDLGGSQTGVIFPVGVAVNRIRGTSHALAVPVGSQGSMSTFLTLVGVSVGLGVRLFSGVSLA